MELCGAVMIFYIKCGAAAHERSFTGHFRRQNSSLCTFFTVWSDKLVMATPTVSGFVFNHEDEQIQVKQWGPNDGFLVLPSIKLAGIQPTELPVGYTFMDSFVSRKTASCSTSPNTWGWNFPVSCLFYFQEKWVSEMQDGLIRCLLSSSKKIPQGSPDISSSVWLYCCKSWKKAEAQNMSSSLGTSKGPEQNDVCATENILGPCGRGLDTVCSWWGSSISDSYNDTYNNLPFLARTIQKMNYWTHCQSEKTFQTAWKVFWKDLRGVTSEIFEIPNSKYRGMFAF